MSGKILIVEDNIQNMKVMVMALRPHGHTLVQAMDGEQAISTAIREKPDLIIMDMRLPKMDGIEVTKKLRSMPEFNTIPIIAVTAYAMKGDRERFIDAGCDGYLSKPIDTRQLPQVIEEMLQVRERES
jgi:CheY-like chemotaxis protein